MRTDVKLGLAASVIVVLLAGWYFFQRDGGDAVIPILDAPPSLTLASPRPAERAPAGGRDGPASRPATPRRSVPSSVPKVRPQADQSPAAPTPRMAPAPRVTSAPAQETTAPGAPVQAPGASDGAIPEADKTESSTALADLFTRPGQGDATTDSRGEKTSTDVTKPIPADAPPADERAVSPRPADAVAGPDGGGGRPHAVSPPTGPRVETHTVRPGDTMLSIARRYYGDARFAEPLLAANRQITDPASLVIGSEILLPELDLPAAKTITPSRASPDVEPARASDAPTRQAPATHATHTVVEGDTLYRIARNHLGEGTRWDDIYELNKALIGDDPAALKVGQVLALPPR